MTLASDSTVEVLGQFPRSFEELPGLHRLLLAVLAARTEQLPRMQMAWPLLVQDTIRALAQGVHITLPEGGLVRAIEAALGDLTDYGMVVPSVNGLSLSPRTLAAEAGWNGAFKELVATVRDI